jgi:DNA-binding LacI/PurR family transcriptional regulator
LGHRTVHHIAGPVGSYSADSRFQVWETTLRDHDRHVPQAPRVEWTPEAGYRAMQALLTDEVPTAIFAANDQIALGVYRAIQEAGLRIPAEISVVGFDDIPEAAMYPPPLTSIAQDWNALGRRALQTALEFRADSAPEAATLPTRLVTRASTAQPPERHP